MQRSLVTKFSHRQLWNLAQLVGGYKDKVLQILVAKRHSFLLNDTLAIEGDSNTLYLSLKNLIAACRIISQNKNDHTFLDTLQNLSDNLEKGNKFAMEISRFAHEYDYSSDVVGNGYRSFLDIFCQCVSECINVLQKVSPKRKSPVKELGSWSQTLGSISTILELITIIRSHAREGELFSQFPPQEIMKHVEKVNLLSFYGPSAGFQYHKEVRQMLKATSVGMASAADAYDNNGSLFSKGLTYLNSGLLYTINEEKRAETLIKAIKRADLDFFRGFFNSLDEGLMGKLPHLMCPKMAVHQVLSIPPLKIAITTVDGTAKEIHPPALKVGLRPLECTVLSAHTFQGLFDEWSDISTVRPPSKNLIIHLHGGGFVATSSNFAQLFLRHWAVEVGCPIISVDYTLAPDAQFPRQVEESFFAYCWCLNNLHLLGTTGEKIIISGDSAGGTLALGLTLRCLQEGIRLPTGLMICYAPVHVDFVPSPARIFTLMDPVIPFNFLMKCLDAYAGDNMPRYQLAQSSRPESDQSSRIRQESERAAEDATEYTEATFQQNPTLSPIFSDDDTLARFPPMSIVTTTRDFCLDDCIEFAKKVRSAGGPVTLDIMKDLPHAFLQFTNFSKSGLDASLFCVGRIKKMLD